MSNRTVIGNLDIKEIYKYLGIEESDGIDNTHREEYLRRARQILKSELNHKNKITATNTLAVAVISYSFGIADWLRTDIEKMDRKTINLPTIGGNNLPEADVKRLHIKRRESGRNS